MIRIGYPDTWAWKIVSWNYEVLSKLVFMHENWEWNINKLELVWKEPNELPS